MSLVLLAILVVIWASILVPLLHGDHGNWPGRGRGATPSGKVPAGRGGRAVWRPAPEFLEEAEVIVPDLVVVPSLGGETGRDRPGWDEDGDDEAAEAGLLAWSPAPGRGRPAPTMRRAVFRRRQVLAVLLLAAAATAVPALLFGGGWLAPAAAAGLLLAAYLLALVLLARRRHGATGSAPVRVPATTRSLAAVPAAPE